MRESQRKIITEVTEEQDASRLNDNRSNNSSGKKGLIRQQREEQARKSNPSPMKPSVTKVQPSENIPQKMLDSVGNSNQDYHDGSFETNEDREDKGMRFVSPSNGGDKIVM